ncbi:integrase [Pyrococcus kukulkanii]|uniref:Tyr recombinase domain-containing protein n=1 Tax=Pyrococcus kukulkanii TaxID=1609559 RepID=A0A127BA12_9EURY|nr:integrase [Pyrococcus kukulkanii]AMM54183.1 hypothetical protein TQ32_06610 [Pyrococcus kukulkanii]
MITKLALGELREFKSKNQAKALRVFVRFLAERNLLLPEETEFWLSTVKVPSQSEGGGLVEFYTPEELTRLLRKFRRRDERLYYLIRLGIESGLRRSELALAVSMLHKKKYQTEGEVSWVVLQKDNKTKRAFYCFCLKETADYFIRSKPYVSTVVLEKYSREHGIKWHKLRKTQATYLARLGVSPEVIDYVQGRTARSILARHYLNLFTLSLETMKEYLSWLKGEVYSHLP